ncbi:MAG: DUF1554 domain-containing protein [Archangium sp.]|nr:DUF1554 domain-containing protein [Archangium sp.]
MNRALLAAVLVAAASCGPTTAQYVCGPNNCTGCCASAEICDTGTTDFRCGKGGASCNVCGGSAPLCVDQACGVEALPTGAKLVFVTRTTYSGNLGGLSGADGLCAAAAGAGALSGTWRAWLSNTVGTRVNAFDRIQGDGPWYLTGTDTSGRRIKAFNNKASLRTAPLAPIDRNELGVKLSNGQFVWTGTEPTGNASAAGGYDNSCANWSESAFGNQGDIGDVYGQWTNQRGQECSSMAALYCFQQ